jgi:hypothetical protein
VTGVAPSDAAGNAAEKTRELLEVVRRFAKTS